MLNDNPMNSKECRLKLSQHRKGIKRDKSIYIKQSKSLSSSCNSLGLYRVSKIKCKECKYGSRFFYKFLTIIKVIKLLYSPRSRSSIIANDIASIEYKTQ